MDSRESEMLPVNHRPAAALTIRVRSACCCALVHFGERSYSLDDVLPRNTSTPADVARVACGADPRRADRVGGPRDQLGMELLRALCGAHRLDHMEEGSAPRIRVCLSLRRDLLGVG